MKELLKVLQRPLDLTDIDFMPKSLSGEWAQVLAYKNARVDMRRLDEATDGMWQNEYKRDSNGILQCGIGIKYQDEWVWKWSNGTPSKTEAEKGEYSDAFKRAGFMVGIGRELYEYPPIFVQVGEGETEERQGKKVLSRKFTPQRWNWEHNKKTNQLTAKDAKGKVRVSIKVDAMMQPAEPQVVEEVEASVAVEKVEIDTLAEVNRLIAKHDVDEALVRKSYGVFKLEDISPEQLVDLKNKLTLKYEGSDTATGSTNQD